ncbi:MAG: T9SS type A sorting domain-containing protein [Bacteroidota bacterium]
MKKYFLSALFFFTIYTFTTAQVICIKCYHQNDSISTGVTNLLHNGGFEISTCAPGWVGADVWCPNSNNYSCNIAYWTAGGGASGSYACIFDTAWSKIIEGNYAAYFGNGFAHVCSLSQDDTSCISNILCTLSGIPNGFPLNDTVFGGPNGVTLQQTVSGLTVGNIYILEFWAGGEWDFGTLPANGVFAVDVGFGDTLLQNNQTPPNTGTGITYLIEFRATSSSHTIKFTNWGHVCSICTELVLDNVRLYTLAELAASVPSCTSETDFPNLENLENLTYPNPVTNELNIKTFDNGLSEIIIYDIASRKLFQNIFSKSVSLNTEQLSKGIYFYEIKKKNGLIQKGKVVKE